MVTTSTYNLSTEKQKLANPLTTKTIDKNTEGTTQHQDIGFE